MKQNESGVKIMPLVGALYMDGKKIMDVKEADFDSITIDPEEKKSTVNGVGHLLSKSVGPMEFTASFDSPRLLKRQFRKLEGWKSYRKPRYRTRKRAVKLLLKKNPTVLSAKDIRRELLRWKETMRRRALKARKHEEVRVQ